MKLIQSLIPLALVVVAVFADCNSCHDEGAEWFCPSANKCYKSGPLCHLGCTAPCQSTRSCNSCWGGYNCTCEQCVDLGYSHICPKYKNCYNSLMSCEASCGINRCHDTREVCLDPRENCTAEQQEACDASKQTCCLDHTRKPFCAPFPNAKCCMYKDLVCKQGQVCFPPDDLCITPQPDPRPNCGKCIEIITALERAGCDTCATLFPEFEWLCKLIKALGVCEWIEKKALPPKNICAMIGLCGEVGCNCGYCRPQVFGHWCLAFPNACPSNRTATMLGSLSARGGSEGSAPRAFRTPADRDEYYANRLRGIVHMLRAREQRRHEARDGRRLQQSCLAGVCNLEHVGCCLSCAPQNETIV